jgi:hypothetical protein
LGITKQPRWIYFLPILHLCACAASAIGLAFPRFEYFGAIWPFITLADLPISLVSFALVWKYSSLSILWILVVGTAWWYLLSLGLRSAFEHFADRSETQIRGLVEHD